MFSKVKAKQPESVDAAIIKLTAAVDVLSATPAGRTELFAIAVNLVASLSALGANPSDSIHEAQAESHVNPIPEQF